MENNDNTISKFDRAVACLLGGNGLKTKPTTIEHVEKITGQSETFILQTVRDENGNHVIIKFVDNSGVQRLILPPRAVMTLVRHLDGLTTRARSNSSKATAAQRKAEGKLPGFMKK